MYHIQCIYASGSLDMHEWRCIPMQLCVCSNISGQNLPVPEQVYAFQLAVGWGTAGGGGRCGTFCISSDRKHGCISHARSVGHRQVTTGIEYQVWACCRLMVALVKRDKGLLVAPPLPPLFLLMHALNQARETHLHCSYFITSGSPPLSFNFFSSATEVIKNFSLSTQFLPFPSHCSMRGALF